MSEEALEKQLPAGATGHLHVDLDEAEAELDVTASGPVGVELERVRVRRGRALDVAAEAERLSRRLERHLDEQLTASEVDPRLGGAVLRTRPDQVRGREFYELEIQQSGELELRRKKAKRGGGWSKQRFPMTRRQLGRVLEELAGDKDPTGPTRE